MSELKRQEKEIEDVILDNIELVKPLSRPLSKPFRPSIAEIIEKAKKKVALEKEEVVSLDSLITEFEFLEMAQGLEQLDKTDEQTALINMMDPRNDSQYFNDKYTAWSRDNTNTHTDAASIGSKVSFWLGSTFIANPASKGVPDYIWYLPKDRMTVFRGHFDPKEMVKNDSFILATNRYIILQNRKISMRIAHIFLIFGLVFGGGTWAATKAKQGYISIANKFRSAENQQSYKEQRILDLKKEAEELMTKASSGEINEAEFMLKASALRAKEMELGKEFADGKE